MPPNNSKNIEEFSDDELRGIHASNPQLAEDIRGVFLQKENFLRSHIHQINEYFSDFTARNGVLMTIAGVLSFLPPLAGSSKEYLVHFLMWSFPLLLAALCCHFRSSARVMPIVKGIGFFPTRSDDALISLRIWTSYLEKINKMNVDLFDAVAPFNFYVMGLIYAYIFSLSIFFYIFTFYGKPPICTSIIVTLAAVFIAAWIDVRRKLKSEKGLRIGS